MVIVNADLTRLIIGVAFYLDGPVAFFAGVNDLNEADFADP